MNQEIKKQSIAIVFALSIMAIGGAVKAVKDVEGMKVKIKYLFDYVKETRQDVKEIKSYLLKERLK